MNLWRLVLGLALSMMASLAERGDPAHMFPAQVILTGVNDTGREAAVMKRVKEHQRNALAAALNRAGDNRGEWLDLLETVTDEHFDAALFLVLNMPPRDLRALTADFLREQIEGAYEAWEGSPWQDDVPEELFLQYVLPYAHFNERRENWRADFMQRLKDRAWSFQRPVDATIWLNNELNDLFQVYFHATKRPKPDQSPSESIKAGYASCTGLSILLADSCRSVGIPARLVGVPRWTEINGNHTWVEIWDQQWHNVGGTGSDPRDDDWVNERCRTQTDPDRRLNSVYAACFRQTDLTFPLVWDMDIDYVPALNVTRFYSAADEMIIEIPGGGEGVVSVGWSGELIARKAGTNTVSFSLATNLPYDIRITTSDGQVHRQTQTFSEGLAGKDVSRATRVAYDQLLLQSRADRQAELEAREITRGDKSLKWMEKTFGEAPEGGRSLWISMHGGGGAPAQVNQQQWQNQIRLYEPGEGIYLAPRAPTDTWDLWHQAHIDPLFDRLIEDFVALRGVNPDKVYLMGYSAGGDGVWQVAPRMADRFAAAAMMGGHPNEASLLGLRNLPFAIFMGANDGAYNRNTIAAEKTAALEKLRADDPGGYVHISRIYEGLGHWMNGKDQEALPWMAGFTRNPWPKKLVWVQDDVTHDRFYWLRLPEGSATKGQQIVAEVNGQHISLEGDVPTGIRIRLSDALVDLDRAVTVTVHGETIFSGAVTRKADVVMATLSERLDPAAAACAEIVVKCERLASCP